VIPDPADLQRQLSGYGGRQVPRLGNAGKIVDLCRSWLFPEHFPGPDDLNELAGELNLEPDRFAAFLEAFPEIQRKLWLDAQAALDGDPAASNLDEIILVYPGFLAVLIYRLAHCLQQLQEPLRARALAEWAHSQTGADIHPAAEIGERFFIDHASGVVIGATSQLGRGVRLYQGVTLGALSLPRDEDGKVVRGQKRHPTLEDDVTVYANATILGGQTVIGRGSVIGASVFLTRSVPPHHRVILEPPRLLIKGPREAQAVLTCPIDFEI